MNQAQTSAIATSKDHKYLKWASYGASIFSTCAKRQYMAVIVDEHGFVVGVGYNGVPSGFQHCIDGGCPRLKMESSPGQNYDNCLSNHAEQNAIMNPFTRDSMRNGTLYINGEPCFTCAKLIIGAEVKRVVYTSDPEYVYPEWHKVEDIFERANVALIHITMEQLNAS